MSAPTIHQRGAASEHLVAAHYLAGGREVCWPSNPASPYDLVALGPTERVQVKTARLVASGPHRYLKSHTVARPRPGVSPRDLYDTLAVVAPPHLWLVPSHLIGERQLIVLEGPEGSRKERTWDAYRTALVPPRI